ncbi:hypothetical protein [Rhodoferax sediminis]|uniref:Uncharacterized protein n=1 Tax=Rhodoferax sediminis TaxID=2509614 RepID=A0A515D844_9BURK|nr:hypothetical protein [Rhodoferax sediminis]QDL36591.1 hypothetical protein EUB48_04220 [Rhodoferax sediminis]
MDKTLGVLAIKLRLGKRLSWESNAVSIFNPMLAGQDAVAIKPSGLPVFRKNGAAVARNATKQAS